MKKINYKLAGLFLSIDDNKEIKRMVDVISKAHDGMILDYIDGISVWEKINHRLSAKEFLTLIYK